MTILTSYKLVFAAFERMTESLAKYMQPSTEEHQLRRLCDISRRVLAVNTTFEASGELCLMLNGPFLSSWIQAFRETAATKSAFRLTSVMEVICLAIRLHPDIWFEQQAALTEIALRITQLVFSGVVNGSAACSMADAATLLLDCKPE